jgi:hypothetical protein
MTSFIRRRMGRAARPALRTLLLFSTLLASTAAHGADSLRAWNGGPTKTAIMQFVRDVTTPGRSEFVPPTDRIALFTHDGTLSPELPLSVQLAFACERIKAGVRTHPAWKSREPFKSALARDGKALAARGPRGGMELLSAACAGMTTEKYQEEIRSWLLKGRNQKLNRLYARSAYEPMRELLEYLRANGFKVFIVTPGDAEFLRAWSEKTYGVPAEQVIGSSIRTKFTVPTKGTPSLILRPAFDLLDAGGGMPEAIHRWIGRRPVLIGANSDRDLPILEWATSGTGRRLALLLRHTDGEGEFAYDRNAVVGRLDRGLEAAKLKGWTVVDMTKDWNRIFAKSEN